VSASPEFESCREVAEAKRVPLREVYAAAEAAARAFVVKAEPKSKR